MHPRFGTRNFILPLSGGTYVEVVTTLDRPAADRAPFGQAVARRAAEGGGWLGWVVSVDDIAPVETRLGRTFAEGHTDAP
ncbi:VOC family protein [Streptomyces venezuelae]|uniref:VOC family protein n=1 Tax=Streptomyces venezuelae TaxID=54571 RepID=UPI001CC26494|nr:VOC family protein [Streptomyces venezuelae]